MIGSDGGDCERVARRRCDGLIKRRLIDHAPNLLDDRCRACGYDGSRIDESDMQEHPTGSEKAQAARTDEHGRAWAGSQLQIQIAVSRRQPALSQKTTKAIELPAASSLVWTSPLEEDRFAEYMDEAFLRVLGLEHLTPSLAEFWPKSGPRWDGLARVETAGALSGVVLVEAKSYPKEMEGGGCKAKGASLCQIRKALKEAKRWFAVPDSVDWLGPLYQFANRLAHVYFLRERHGIPTWLVNLCVVDDPTWEARWKATPRTEWISYMADLGARSGFGGRPIPWVTNVFLAGQPRSELFGDDLTGEVSADRSSVG